MRNKTKICRIITKLAVGGAQKQAVYLSSKLNNNRFQTEICCGHTDKQYGSLEKEAINKRIPVKKIYGLSNNINPVKYLVALLQLTKHIKKNKFDIVHTHSSVAGILGRIAAKTRFVEGRLSDGQRINLSLRRSKKTQSC